ncbi:hypothetical protein D3C77_369810 [compost metagenome]
MSHRSYTVMKLAGSLRMEGNAGIYFMELAMLLRSSKKQVYRVKLVKGVKPVNHVCRV